MKILVAQDALHAAGGVDSYLARVVPALHARGHSVGVLCNERRDRARSLDGVDGPMLVVSARDPDLVFAEVRRWMPDVCFSHNMAPLHIERRLLSEWPVVKFMHGYFGTCVSALKMHAFPRRQGCARTFGPACLALYAPRHCGRLHPADWLHGYRWANEQLALMNRYAAVIVASGHMAAEYERHGVSPERVTTLPLFPTAEPQATTSHHAASVLFLGRMTALKGGDVLLDAVARASRVLGRSIRIVMAGDGPERRTWTAAAARARLDAVFPGWLDDAARSAAIREAAVVAVPSLWPEPFGLVGLEAAASGVPAVAFDVGGISEWLHHRVNGLLVPPRGGAAAFASALAEVLADPALRATLSAGAIERARELSADAHVAALERVLESAARARERAMAT